MTMFSDMLERDRKDAGLSFARASWLFGVTVREYQEIEAGERWPTFDTYDRICEVFGWPQSFIRDS